MQQAPPKKYKLQEMVQASVALEPIPKYTAGTVVHVYDLSDAYDVEFILQDGHLLATVWGNQIEQL